MKKNKFLHLCLLILFAYLLIGFNSATAKMYKWISEDGSVHFSQMRPPNQQKQKFKEIVVKQSSQKGNKECCLVIRDIANRMIRAQNKGATITDLYSFYHPDLGSLKELANFVSHKFNLGIRGTLISQMTFNACLNAGFNVCKGADAGKGIAPIGIASGSGFFVSTDGHIITNAHVVKECKNIHIFPDKTVAKLIAKDEVNDLALLKIESSPTAIVKFRADDIQLGEKVIVAGFPYRGELSSGINITTGTISSLAGIKNDPRVIQISAPVQPGNSGGPLLDDNGDVIGVIVSKLNSYPL